MKLLQKRVKVGQTYIGFRNEEDKIVGEDSLLIELCPCCMSVVVLMAIAKGSFPRAKSKGERGHPCSGSPKEVERRVMVFCITDAFRRSGIQSSNPFTEISKSPTSEGLQTGMAKTVNQMLSETLPYLGITFTQPTRDSIWCSLELRQLSCCPGRPCAFLGLAD